MAEATEPCLVQTQRDRALDRLLEEQAWTDENHPDLETTEDVDIFVRRLQVSWMMRASDPIEISLRAGHYEYNK